MMTIIRWCRRYYFYCHFCLILFSASRIDILLVNELLKSCRIYLLYQPSYFDRNLFWLWVLVKSYPALVIIAAQKNDRNPKKCLQNIQITPTLLYYFLTLSLFLLNLMQDLSPLSLLLIWYFFCFKDFDFVFYFA